MSEHHVETWMTVRLVCGWQCFTCGAEDGGYPGFLEAERAGDVHRGEAAERDRQVNA